MSSSSSTRAAAKREPGAGQKRRPVASATDAMVGVLTRMRPERTGGEDDFDTPPAAAEPVPSTSTPEPAPPAPVPAVAEKAEEIVILAERSQDRTPELGSAAAEAAADPRRKDVLKEGGGAASTRVGAAPKPTAKKQTLEGARDRKGGSARARRTTSATPDNIHLSWGSEYVAAFQKWYLKFCVENDLSPRAIGYSRFTRVAVEELMTRFDEGEVPASVWDRLLDDGDDREG